jgi:hypothetical protein
MAATEIFKDADGNLMPVGSVTKSKPSSSAASARKVADLRTAARKTEAANPGAGKATNLSTSPPGRAKKASIGAPSAKADEVAAKPRTKTPRAGGLAGYDGNGNQAAPSGVRSGKKKMSGFEQAFATNRKAGKKTFAFKGKSYNTKLKGA